LEERCPVSVSAVIMLRSKMVVGCNGGSAGQARHLCCHSKNPGVTQSRSKTAASMGEKIPPRLWPTYNHATADVESRQHEESQYQGWVFAPTDAIKEDEGF
jgi:hypothetical protein